MVPAWWLLLARIFALIFRKREQSTINQVEVTRMNRISLLPLAVPMRSGTLGHTNERDGAPGGPVGRKRLLQ
ncbi:hypothetical protein BGZ61DRAFT_445157 [Ilyonectria robusta]|uniref:uncharacterized protein n=1 Tax=Ilyonectria robusta TaxID=1079257 RepID=UPI001E8DBD70|nr:uncharacterized protein BGZ61DRAFT_445157 [Ilyonectria robusta]KAH8733732.1 hypothetical protein BGZ61DRAFT_445157 [Ilyonectria robusta]